MNFFIQALGVSLIVFPLIWFFAERREQIAGQQKIVVVLVGVIITACLCSALYHASQVLFGEFVIGHPGRGLQAVFFLGAPLSFAFVVMRLMRPLKPEAMPEDQSLQFGGPVQTDSDASTNLPIRR